MIPISRTYCCSLLKIKAVLAKSKPEYWGPLFLILGEVMLYQRGGIAPFETCKMRDTILLAGKFAIPSPEYLVPTHL